MVERLTGHAHLQTVIDTLGTLGRPGAGPSATTRQEKPVGAPRPAAAPPATGQVTDLLGLFTSKTSAPKGDGSLEFYVAVATTVDIGQQEAEPGYQWHYATGWSRRSGHDAGLEAEKACRGSSGETCWPTGVSSMRGGCVAMVEGLWLDKDDPQPDMQVFVQTSQTRQIAESIALDQCKTVIHAGKTQGTVQEYECNLKVSFCSEDVRP